MKRYLCALVAVGLMSLATYTPELQASATTRSAIRVAVVGDMACDAQDPNFANGGTATHCKQMAVSSLIKNASNPWATVLGLGDFQYDCGSRYDYRHSYNPSYGRLDALMHPTIGNHEYKTTTEKFSNDPCPAGNDSAQSYFQRIPRSHPTTDGYYSFNLGSWHFISLNASCNEVGGCGATAPETAWLRENLSTSKRCIAAFWHQPLYTGAGSGRNNVYQAWWQILYNHHADLVLNGHLHNYQRFARMDPSSNPDPNGITEYIAGTGGEDQVSVSSKASPQPAAWKQAFGYLRLRLTSDGWHSRFMTIGGHVFDRHSGTCH